MSKCGIIFKVITTQLKTFKSLVKTPSYLAIALLLSPRLVKFWEQEDVRNGFKTLIAISSNALSLKTDSVTFEFQFESFFCNLKKTSNSISHSTIH